MKTTKENEKILSEMMLEFAQEEGNLKRIKTLIEVGANVNAKNDLGWTAILYASLREEIEVVKFLIEAGADVNAKDNVGISPLMYADDNKELFEILKAAGAKE